MLASLIADRFELQSEAGTGGMGTVFRALDRRTGLIVAVKMLHSHGAIDAERFARESATLAELDHPQIVRYIAHGVSVRNEPFMAMEWLEGEDLSARLARTGLTIAESVLVTRRAAEALAAAHRRGIVHRDIKPSNLFLVDRELDQVKLLDFGIARRTRDRAMTRTGMLLGTPEYMAPEQARGSRTLDARADVFALGCVLFECLTGQAPFVADSVMAVLARILLDDPPQVSELRTDVPDALADLVAKMMAKSSADRPADAATVAEELSHIDGLPAGERRSAPPREAALTGHEQRVVSLVLVGPHTTVTDVAAQTVAITADDTERSQLAALVERHGGRLELLANGAMVALLAGAGALTDNAAQAARCALAMREQRPRSPVVLSTGRAVLSERLPMGEVIDRGVAALRVAAPGGPVRIDEGTAALIDVRFDVGGDGAGLYLRAERSLHETARTLLGRTTSFVGRDREIATLMATFDESVTEPVARAVLVSAPAGAGKSRLLQEFLQRVSQREGSDAVVLIGRADSVSAGSPFGMLTSAIRSAAGIVAGESLEVRQNKLRARVARHVAPPDVARITAFLGEIIETPSADADDEALRAARNDSVLMGDAMQSAWEDWLSAECAAGPVVLVLEDLHWGDMPTVKFTGGALRTLRERPLLVLALARPEVHQTFPALWAEHELHEVKLAGLTRKASEKLIREVLGDGVEPQSLARIVERCEGNAFFLEELIRATAAGTAADRLPDSVLGMLEARLDALGTESRRVLRAASVFGETFWRGGVLKLLGSEHRTSAVVDTLDDLAVHEMIAPTHRATLPGETEYAFRHALVRDATYATLTEHDRTLGHRLAAEWLERAGSTDAAVLAEHFDLGGEAPRAIHWHLRAAEAAVEASHIDAMFRHAGRALALGAEGEERDRLMMIRGEAYFYRGEHVEGERTAVAALAMMRVGTKSWFFAISGAVLAAAHLGKTAEFMERVEAMLSVEPGAGAVHEKINAICRAHSFFIQEAEPAMLERARTIVATLAARAPDMDATMTARVRQFLRNTSGFEHGLEQALDELNATLALYDKAGNKRSSSLVRNNAGFVLCSVGRLEEAEAMLRVALRDAERIGAHHTVLLVQQNLGDTLTAMGRLTEARALVQAAIQAAVKQANPRLEGAARIYLARIELALRCPEAAEREANRAHELLEVAPVLRVDAASVWARALLQLGRLDEALPLARGAAANPRSTQHWRMFRALNATVLAEVLRATGAVDEAREVVRDAFARLGRASGLVVNRAAFEMFLKRAGDNPRLFALGRELGVEMPPALSDALAGS